MGKYIIKRLWQGVITLFALTIISFAIVRSAGDPLEFILPIDATQSQYDQTGKLLGLDKPIPVQYFLFVGRLLTGDFGASVYFRGQDSLDLVIQRFPATLQLSGTALLILLVISVPIGVLSAVKRDSPIDYIGKLIAVVGQASPQFWLGIMLIWIFGVTWQIFPVAGKGTPMHLVLPSITLGWFAVAGLMRLIRSSMLDALDSEYVKLARVKGLSESRVVWKHALKNAAIPPLTFFAVLAGAFLTGSVVVESVFAWNGVGLLAIEAMRARDFPVIQGIIFLYGGMYVVLMLLVDILYGYLDPRIRFS